MKHLSKILALCLLSVATAQAGNLYVLRTSGDVDQVTVGDVRSLTFTATRVQVNKTDGTSIACLYSALRYLSLTAPAGETTGIADADAVSASVYPNPAADYLTVRADEGIQQVQLCDLNGRALQQLELPLLPAVTLPLSAYAPGIYLVRITTARGEVTRKIIKQ
jgi:hypothetical protein